MSFRHVFRGFILSNLFFSLLFIFGCGNESKKTPPPEEKVMISGSVAAPGGAITFNNSSRLWQFLSRLFVKEAHAAGPRISPVGANIKVRLLQINKLLSQIGNVIASGITDSSGNYKIYAPKGFTPSSIYVVQAESASEKIQAFVTKETVDITPFTETAVSLIAESVNNAGAELENVRKADVEAIHETIYNHRANISTVSITASQMVTNLKNEVKNTRDSINIVTNITYPGGITGTVKDSSNLPVVGIIVKALTFGELVQQAVVRTDESGSYTLHVPPGNYMLVAANDTTTSTAASEWWTSSGGTSVLWGAEKIVISNTIVTRNFNLLDGGRITGRITAEATGYPLDGVKVNISNYKEAVAYIGPLTDSDGKYILNVREGDYYLWVSNFTLHPYASEYFSSSINGSKNKIDADKITVVKGSNLTCDMSLLDGYKIEGIVTDASNVPAAGVLVKISNTRGTVFNHFAKVDGSYCFWLRPSQYQVMTRGQKVSPVDITSANKVQSFNADMKIITLILKDTDGNPLSQIFAQLKENNAGTFYPVIDWACSGGDGSVKLYSPAGIDVILTFTSLPGLSAAASIYNGKVDFADRDLITVNNDTDLGNVTLQKGVMVTGTITKNGVPSPGGIMVRKGGKEWNNTSFGFGSANDGSYIMSLPENVTFDRVCAADVGFGCPGSAELFAKGATWNYIDSVLTGASGTTQTLDFSYP